MKIASLNGLNHDPLYFVRRTKIFLRKSTEIQACSRVFRVSFVACLFFLPSVAIANDYRLLGWNDFMPPSWNRMAELERFGVHDLEDDDPRAPEIMKHIREAWETIPPVSSLDGLRIRIQGFVVPLTEVPEGVVEFLLVPSQGQCIHYPPPPPNQVLYAVAKTPIRDLDINRPVYAFGELSVVRTDTAKGIAGYRLDIEKINPYLGNLKISEWWWGAKRP